MYQALYRKYRPSVFSDVVGQDHITVTLKNELATGKISHAYLFTGTRGTGKTTCAKILAKAVNCLCPVNGDPCGECDACRAIENGEVMDIVELDAASNNGVDDVRDLRDRVAFTPANAKYRVYIIDEVHMLSKPAFNALLKTLEEPPAHVIFILATTEVNELPATILSRCQRFDFKRIEPGVIASRLSYVANKEDLSLDGDASALIASIADGGMRDALSVLDLCAAADSNITEAVVQEVCGMAGHEYLYKLSENIRERNTEECIMTISRLYNDSVDMVSLCNELIAHYRNLMIMKTVSLPEKPVVCSASEKKELERQAKIYDLKDILFALDLLQDTLPKMKTANRRCEMEMAVIKLCSPALSETLAGLEARVSALENGTFKKESTSPKASGAEDKQPSVTEVSDEEIPLPSDSDEIPQTVAFTPEDSRQDASSDEERPIKEWNDILTELQKVNPLMASVLKGSRAFIKGEYLLIDSADESFRDIMNGSAHNRETLKRAVAAVLGRQYNLGPYHRENKAESQSDPLLAFKKKLDLLNK